MKQGTREKLVWMASVIHTALVTDDERLTKSVLGDVAHEIAQMYGKGPVVAETRLDSGAFLTPRAVLDELAHGCSSTQEEEE